MTIRTVKLLEKFLSIESGFRLCGVVTAVILFFSPGPAVAATSSSSGQIEWLRKGWRGEQISEVEEILSHQSPQIFLEKFEWLKMALEKAVDLSCQLYISPDGYAYYFESGQSVGQAPVTTVYRVFPGKTEPETFATGLRQPLPIVFDAFGHAFVLDSGLGDSGGSRWIHLIEQADYDWRNVGDIDSKRGGDLFAREHRWLANSISPLRHVMPHLAVMAYHPFSVISGADTGWSLESPQIFFAVGEKDGSYQLDSYVIRCSGTEFDLVPDAPLARSETPVFLILGAESELILNPSSVSGTENPRQASIRYFDPKFEYAPEAVRTRQLLATDPMAQSVVVLIQWLDHRDRRIRMKAQFALVDRGEAVLEILLQRAKNPFQTIGRMHALWTLRLILSQLPELRVKLTRETWGTSLLADPAPSVRSAALEIYAMMGGDDRETFVSEALVDVDPKVRLQAVKLLGIFGMKASSQRLLDWIGRSENQQYAQQHAAMISLSNLMSAEELAELAAHSDDKVRMAALLGLRRRRHVGVQGFLHDTNPWIILEAARAILQEPVMSALPVLAEMHANRSDWSPAFASVGQHSSEWSLLESMQECVYAANAMLQQPIHIQALAEAAESRKYGEEMRSRCLERLLHWLRKKAQYSSDWDESFDVIWNGRAENWGKADLEGQRCFILEFFRFREWKHHAPLVESIFRGYKESHQNRAKALRMLADWRVPHLQSLIRDALTSNSALLRKEAVLIQSDLNPDDQVAAWVRQLESAVLSERLQALKQLGPSKDRRVDSVLLYWLEEALNGRMPSELHSDLIEAAQHRTPPVIRQKLADLKAKDQK